MADPDESGTEIESGQTEEEGRGCFYAVNTLMILGFLIPVLVLLIFFILWLIPD